MTGDIIARTISEAEYLIENKSTVRKTAEYFNVSKSTLHTDITTRLKQIDYDLFRQVDEILKYNFSVRHIRGGQSTKNKYLNIKP